MKPPRSAPVLAFTAEPDAEVPVALPPTAVARGGEQPVAQGIDLAGKPKLTLLIGAGRTGKTTLARWIGEKAAGEKQDVALAAADPLNRSLANYFENVAQPDGNDPAATAAWLERLFGHVMNNPASVVLDLGGGDTSLGMVLRAAPDLPQMMAEAGCPMVALYVLGPRVDDLAAPAAMDALGFRPEARAIVLNEGVAEATLAREDAFGRVLRHSAYRAAIDGGAVPLWMPRIAGSAAGEVEGKRLSFHAAAAGISPPDRKVVPMGPFDRSRVRRWLADMKREFAGVASWMP